MNRYAVLATVSLFGLADYVVAAPAQSPDVAPPSVQDYKNRPDPCELKHREQPVTKSAAPAPARKTTETPGR